MPSEPMRIGVVGCGAISGIYFQNLATYAETEVVSCADLDVDKAKAAAEKYGIAQVQSVDALLANSEVDLVLNLTVPKAHYSVNIASLQAGKHVYVEKPLAVEREEGQEMMKLAQEKGLRVGCAPDTVLGAGIQTCRKLIDDGLLGKVIGGNSFMQCPGHESWHPSPEFYYEKGGGPLFDMGPYYLSAFVTLLGPVEAVTSVAKTTYPTRTITSEAKRGKVVEVETPTHIVSILEFANGAAVQLTTSFDVQASRLPNIELYGTEGSISVPDPNGFGGPIQIRVKGQSDWQDQPHTHPHPENGRGLGVRDLVQAIRENRPARAGGEVAFHVLDIMHACLESALSGHRVKLQSSVPQPVPMPAH
ncbi:MAG: Gfo/Idh/MocA family oxidoreductase [Fimbriimonadaceae bacterium]|nr:Gfo/Idh/MocA family oxidoreductase [Fimbriimonadaceae bacterium]